MPPMCRSTSATCRGTPICRGSFSDGQSGYVWPDGTIWPPFVPAKVRPVSTLPAALPSLPPIPKAISGKARSGFPSEIVYNQKWLEWIGDGRAAPKRRRMKKLVLFLVGLALAAAVAGADAATMVPAGNRNSVQPDIPGASSRRTQATNTTFQAKYRKVYALLQNDAELRAKIRKAAAAYGIDPMHIVGAIVGEHTYNVDAYDRLQTYYVKAISYLSSRLSFAYDGEDIPD